MSGPKPASFDSSNHHIHIAHNKEQRTSINPFVDLISRKQSFFFRYFPSHNMRRLVVVTMTVLYSSGIASGFSSLMGVQKVVQHPTNKRKQQQQRALSSSATTDARDTTATTPKDDDKNIINPLVRSIEPSPTVAIFSRVKEMQAAGQTNITSLCVGEPDFSPPPVVMDTLHCIEEDTRYTAVAGTPDVRQAIAEDLQRRGRICNDGTDIANTILVSNGAKQSVFQAVWAVAGVGDAVLIPAPYWPSYPAQVQLCTGTLPIVIPTTAEDGYLMTPQQLREALVMDKNRNIKALILCHPSNPTGAVYSREQLQALGDVLQEYGPGVVVIADEIYERLIYDGTECPSVATSLGSSNPVITINGFSKAYAMTGFRLGYATVASGNNSNTQQQQMLAAMTTLQSQLTSCASSIAQAAATAALVDPPTTDAWLAERTVELAAKRDLVWDRLAAMPGIGLPPHKPPGAFYILVDLSQYCASSSSYTDVTLCEDLLQRQALALVPGTSFGAPGTVRISYATSRPELETAMDKLERFLAEERERKGLQHLE